MLLARACYKIPAIMRVILLNIILCVHANNLHMYSNQRKSEAAVHIITYQERGLIWAERIHTVPVTLARRIVLT